MKKINWKKTGNIFYWILFIVLLFIAGVVAVSALNLPNGIKIYTVQSGSMSPGIPAGSIVVSKPFNSYQKGDVITFKSETVVVVKNPKLTTTHRIYEVKIEDGKEQYITKGDANDAPDSVPTSKDLVLGKTIFSIPLLGYPVSFAKTREGLIILVVIPATIIVYSEAITIKNEAAKLLAERRKRKLTLTEKTELEIGEEEIKIERWYKKLWKKIISPLKKKNK